MTKKYIKNLDLGEIVANYLDENEFDGLYNIDAGCACKKDDLSPCGEAGLDCISGHYLQSDCIDHDYHIGNKTDPDNIPKYKCKGT